MDFPVTLQAFYVFLLTLSRTAGLVFTAPILGSAQMPKPVSMGLSALLALALTPHAVQHTSGALPSSLFVLGGGVLSNAIFGITVGTMAQLLFSSLQIAGTLIDTQMGFGFVNLFNPFLKQESSVQAVFQFQLGILLYLLMNGHLILLGGLSRSFSVLPPDHIVLHAAFWTALLPLFKSVFLLALTVALPALGTLFLMDVGMGLVARMAPQINVFIVGMPAKIAMGMFTLALAAPAAAIATGRLLSGVDAGLLALMAGAK